MFAILKAYSNASSKGLQTRGVRGSTISESCRRKCSQMFKTSAVVGLDSEGLVLLEGFRVSKLMILSKQSSNPRILSALIAWFESAFVNIWETKNRHHHHPEDSISHKYCFQHKKTPYKLTIFLIGKLCRIPLRTGSGFNSTLYGNLPWTKLFNQRKIPHGLN